MCQNNSSIGVYSKLLSLNSVNSDYRLKKGVLEKEGMLEK